MSSVYPWIYVDDTNNIWKFTINDIKELRYNIMYGEGKWTKESLIDIDVLGFAVHIDEDEIIHIVYSNINGDLKYCTMRNKQWIGKVLYRMESDEFEMHNFRIEIVAGQMHIFYMLIANDGSDHGVLMHCTWNGKEAIINALQDIILVPNVKVHYLLQLNNKNILDLFFITDEGDEASLQCCSFKNNQWTAVKRLYGIQGENISFEVLSYEQDIHILNRSKEDSTYLLDHVAIDVSGKIKGFRIFESTVEPVEPLLVNKSNNLCCCWIEEHTIFYSIFDGEKWSIPICVDKTKLVQLKRYNSLMGYDENDSIKLKSIYGTIEPDLHLFIPNDFIKEINESLSYQFNEVDSDSFPETREIQIIKNELQKVKGENKNLEKKIASLNMQLQKKERFIGDYEETIAKILDQKRKVEENSKIYLEVQKDNQKELERIKKQLSDETLIGSEIKDKLMESEEENKKLQIQVEKIIEENHILNIKLKEMIEDNEKLQIEFEKISELNKVLQLKVNTIDEEREFLKEQLEQKQLENMKLLEELEFEKNQSIMDRLLRRKAGEV